MRVEERIREKLARVFAPQQLTIVDESALHAGHSGARPGGETHFRVRIVSDAFNGLTRVARHRRVFDVLSEELNGSVHALALTTLTPGDDAGSADTTGAGSRSPSRRDGTP
jgi:BolA protein